MPQEIKAVECAYCHKLHPKTGRYIIVETIKIKEKQDDKVIADPFHKRDAETIVKNDCIVCDNECLSSLISLKGY